jgi:hypothetical protein
MAASRRAEARAKQDDFIEDEVVLREGIGCPSGMQRQFGYASVHGVDARNAEFFAAALGFGPTVRDCVRVKTQ